MAFPHAGEAELSFIGSVSTGLIGLLSLISGRLCDRFGYRNMIVIGGCIASVGLVLASFATNVGFAFFFFFF